MSGTESYVTRGYQSAEDQMRMIIKATQILMQTRTEVVCISEQTVEVRRETNAFWDRPINGFPIPDIVRNRPNSTNLTIVAEARDEGVRRD